MLKHLFWLFSTRAVMGLHTYKNEPTVWQVSVPHAAAADKIDCVTEPF